MVILFSLFVFSHYVSLYSRDRRQCIRCRNLHYWACWMCWAIYALLQWQKYSMIGWDREEVSSSWLGRFLFVWMTKGDARCYFVANPLFLTRNNKGLSKMSAYDRSINMNLYQVLEFWKSALGFSIPDQFWNRHPLCSKPDTKAAAGLCSIVRDYRYVFKGSRREGEEEFRLDPCCTMQPAHDH